MSKVTRTAYLKTKIVLSFSVVITVLAVAGYITYQNFETLDNALIELSKPNVKLRLYTQLLGEITSSENEIRKLVLNNNKSLISKYEKSIIPVFATLDSLKKLVNDDTIQSEQINEVKQLLKAKKGSFNAYIIQKRRAEQFDTYEAVLDIASENKGVESESQNNKTAFKKSIKPNIPDSNLSLPILFKEYKNAIENYYKEYTKLQFSPDNVVEMDKLESILSNVEFSQSTNLATMTDKELELLQNNTEIAERIRAIIGKLERDERQEIEKRQTHTREVIKEANNTLYTITFVAFFLIALFTYLILSDITKSNFYRKQLISAKLKAERLSKVKQEFLANMSHEIRTPLNAIIGFAEQLGQTKINTQQETHLQAVKYASEHLLNTVNDILDFSKIDAGKLSLEKIPFRLDHTIQNVCKTLQIKADQKGIQLDTSLDKDFDQIVLGDSFRLQQVLLNLVNNAIKFTDEGFVEVEGEVLDKMGKNIKVRIRINDTGIGIPKNKLNSIFQNFSQADTSTTRKYGGTGLGLSIAQRLVKLMNGRISVESDAGKGASFIIDLKLEKAGIKELEVHNQSKNKPEIKFKKGHILVVDDDHFNLLLSQTILKKTTLKVSYASNGKEAMKYLKKHPIDLLITDIQMPGVSGLELAKFTRSLKKPIKSVPIIAFTANVMQEDLEKFSKHGINDYLLKPFKEHEFLLKIKEHLPETFTTLTEVSSKKEEKTSSKIAEQPTFYTLQKISQFAGQDKEALQQIIEQFISSSFTDIEIIENALKTMDRVVIAEKAHKLLNGFHNFEVNEAILLLKRLEKMSKDIKDQDIRLDVEKLIDLHKKLIENLQNEIKSMMVS